MSGYASLDAQVIAEVLTDLQSSADSCAEHAARLRDKASERFADDVNAEYADACAHRYRQLAVAVERGLFRFLDHEPVNPELLRRLLTPADMLATMTPGEQLIALSNTHFALPIGGVK